MQLVARLHECRSQSRVAFGSSVGLNSPAAAELLVGGTTLDFIVMDLQHSPVGAQDATHLLRAVQAADPKVSPVARVPNHGVYWIQQTLDAGYVGLIVPLVESAAQAEKLVAAAYFPPLGARSTAGSIRASLYDDYARQIDEQLILLPQIESAGGLEHVEEIVAVEGVTGVLMGPADLSLSCGWSMQDLWSHEPYLAATRRIVDACRNHGKDAAILTAGDGVFHARDHGFNIIGMACDAAYLRTRMTSDIDAAGKRVRSGQ